LQFHGCNDLHILHGVFLNEPEPPLVRIGAGKAVKRDGLFLTPVELLSVRGDGREIVHATAEIVLGGELPVAPSAVSQPATGPYPLAPEQVYRTILFHGPALQGIDRVEGCGANGIVATVRSAPAPAAWIRQPLRQKWLSDPLAVDAALQLMILWCFDQHRACSLPCGVARYRQYRRSFPSTETRAVVLVRRDSPLHVLADVDFLDADGLVVARVEGCETIIDPKLQAAFRRNQVTRATPPRAAVAIS
jgi:hypothetical protein